MIRFRYPYFPLSLFLFLCLFLFLFLFLFRWYSLMEYRMQGIKSPQPSKFPRSTWVPLLTSMSGYVGFVLLIV